ncbi:hypothetical protein GCM10008957_45200 [Deinococcus ruber]|uniref:Uncharacterized protein n=2 Tax=Deinococcus ruber TaxID=1848197 RepID=A0A918FBY5_9DEIO|nr:hypothetical protein GCM10008957_45200 [Deinococcus ruber]
MSVSAGDQSLLTVRVSVERLFQVRVPKAALLTITFHDDAYLPNAIPRQDRNLFVRSVRFVATP